MLSITPTPYPLTPILPSMPYSVTVSTVRPSGCSKLQWNQPSDIVSYQSQVCTANGAPPRGTEITDEHSCAPVGLAATSSSVRALIEASSRTGRPAPSAMPAISSAWSGATRPIDSQARSDQRSTSKSRSPARVRNSRRYVAAVAAISAANRSPSSSPRSRAGRTEEVNLTGALT